uniref:Uncharacterized protein n=1 Tax=Lepeophtheirus salmonis TaxID=72036 RepID=A0A0K2UXA8_LEPSM
MIISYINESINVISVSSSSTRGHGIKSIPNMATPRKVSSISSGVICPSAPMLLSRPVWHEVSNILFSMFFSDFDEHRFIITGHHGAIECSYGIFGLTLLRVAHKSNTFGFPSDGIFEEIQCNNFAICGEH